jgi:iron complex outermembrane receptor protein
MAPTPDAAQLLRTVPGFSLSRIGGAASDPLLRGLNGSRVQIVVDGDPLEGACSHRMDPPTSYLAGDSFDRVNVTKGPSTVRFGPAIAGTVEFARDTPRPESRVASARADVQAGSFQQRRGSVEVRAGSPVAAVRAYGTAARSDNYLDGNGDPVHSFYDRYNAGATASLFASENTRAEITAETGDGEAAYPTFHMDGTRFLRNRVAGKVRVANPGGPLARAELRAAYADVDHRMDDFSLRPPRVTTTTLPGGALVQTNRLAMDQTLLARSVAAETLWVLPGGVQLLAGADYGDEQYDGRNATATTSCLSLLGTTNCVESARAWTQYDLRLQRMGAFAEADWWASDRTRIKGGLRVSRRESTAGELFDFVGLTPLPGANSQRVQVGRSGFVRAESELAGGWSGFVALGGAERPPNALEITSFSGFYLAQERNRQIDAGLAYAAGSRQLGADVFYNRIDDFILVFQGTQSINVDARMFGGELYASQGLGERLRASASLTWVRGDNLSFGRPLAQMPPLEFRVGTEYAHGTVVLGVSGRLVARQDRVDVGYGNVTGVDLGETPGFGVWGVRAGWQAHRSVRLSFGVDNVFDKFYAEHLNRTGAFAPPGFLPNFRVPEPGRFLWLRLDAQWS